MRRGENFANLRKSMEIAVLSVSQQGANTSERQSTYDHYFIFRYGTLRKVWPENRPTSRQRAR